MPLRSWVPDNIPLDRPSAARMYDYALGGYHNFEIDRRAGDQVATIFPDLPLALRANRAFMRRAVTFLVEQGIDQFLDLGSGIPTVGNVHEVAQAHNPAARVVYVDSDPIAVRHSELILQDNPNATVLQADVRDPEFILDHPEARRLLDLSRPLAVMIVALFHFVPDDAEAYHVVSAVRDAVASGSYLAISHASTEGISRDLVQQMERAYGASAIPFKFRSRAQLLPFFTGFDLIEPGLVYMPLWRPDDPDDLLLDHPERTTGLAGVGRKP